MCPYTPVFLLIYNTLKWHQSNPKYLFSHQEGKGKSCLEQESMGFLNETDFHVYDIVSLMICQIKG